MRVLLGNPTPLNGAPGPTVTAVGITDAKNEDGSYVVGFVPGTNAAEVKDHLFDNPGMVTHLPGNTAILSVARTWPDHGDGRPTFVDVDPGERDPAEAEDFERFLSEFYRCDRGIPADLETTHYTESGPPGVGPTEGE